MTVNREVDRAWNSCRFQFPGSEVITSIVLSFIDRDIMKPGNSSDSIKSFGGSFSYFVSTNQLWGRAPRPWGVWITGWVHRLVGGDS